MLKIHKIDASPVIDFAAEELKKYLRMMMPMDGEITIEYKPDAKDGFRLGLMQTFGLDVSDAEVAELDDILYMDTTEEGGIIAGDNARSVLLAVYEYLRQNGCRFPFPRRGRRIHSRKENRSRQVPPQSLYALSRPGERIRNQPPRNA